MGVDFSIVTKFEERIAEFFGAPYAVAVDSCTSGIELCLRYKNQKSIESPRNTYLSIPMLANKLGIKLYWWDNGYQWEDYYLVGYGIYDAAVLWRANSYILNSFMCVSFQYQKHLSVGRLGVILCTRQEDAIALKKLSYDGRLPNIPWRIQDVEGYGYHYYAQPELCELALSKLDKAIATPPRIWTDQDYPDISKFKVFNQ